MLLGLGTVSTMTFVSNFQNKTAEENQRKLSLEMQKIQEEMGKNESLIGSVKMRWQ